MYEGSKGAKRSISGEDTLKAKKRGAFALPAFLIGPVYLTATGHTLTGHMKTMYTGWEEVPAKAAHS
jgi:hypothetical protein